METKEDHIEDQIITKDMAGEIIHITGLLIITLNIKHTDLSRNMIVNHKLYYL